MLSSAQIAALASELAADPATLGYAAQIALGSDSGLLALVNSMTSTAITLTSQPKNIFLTAAAPAAVRLALGLGTDGNPISATLVTAWKAALTHSYAADPGSSIDLGVIAALNAVAGTDPVTAKIMTQGEYLAMTQRPGTRAEVLFGAGVAVQLSDISMALRGAP